MNRRIVLVDQNETPDYVRYFGCCKDNEIYSLQLLETLEEDKLKELLRLERSDGVMLVGVEPFKFLRQFYHYGVRGENYYDCSKLYRLSIEGGAFVRVVTEYPENFVIEDFLSDGFVKPVNYNIKQAVLSTYDEACRFLGWVESFPEDQDFGFDYEGSGMPLDPWYELSGFSIATETFSGFVSLTDIRHEIGTSDGRYNAFLKRVGAWLVKRMSHVWTYNMQYEFQVSHRMLGVDAYNLCDSSVVNTIDGYHLKNFSLKWTAQRILGVDTWDIEFDKISDLIDSMLFTEVGELKKDKKKVLKVTQNNFEQTPEWKELCARYPDYVEEFKQLLLEYWGNAFMCVPSKILGFYCNLDAFYTLMIYKNKQKQYTKECWEINLDNIRLGCRLMSSGLYIDEPYRAKYEHYCKEMMAWGITYCAQMRCHYKMEAHRQKAANIKTYNSVAMTLLRENKFYNGDAIEIVKNLMADNLDTLDTTETGLDEGAISMKYGDDFAGKFIDIVKAAMIETKMKTKIDSGIIRKRKILGIIATNSIPLFGLDKIKLGPKHTELEKYLYYEKAYNELEKVSKKQLTDIYNIPETIYAFGRKWDILEYSDYVSENYFKCKSPLENDEIVYDLTMLLRSQTSFLAAMAESIQQLPGNAKFYTERGIINIQDGFNEFLVEIDKWIKDPNYVSQLYPEKVFNLFKTHYESPTKSKVTKGQKISYVYSCSDKVKDMWTDFAGFNTQINFFPDYGEQELEYGKQYDPSDRNDIFFFMRKVTLNYLLYKKYAKLLSTYVGSDGMFKKNNRYVIEGPDHIPLRYAEPNEPGAIEKCFVKYEVQKKSSKRWSSAFHTIISHGDCKNCIATPYHLDENGNRVDENYLMSYFDISSAEVKASGFASGDPDLISAFQQGIDIYVFSAKLYLGEEAWDKLSDKDKKMWRKRFKTIFLGVLYGLGKNSLASRLECSIEEADRIIQSLYKSFPKLREYVDVQAQYPLDHDGYINTMLGDKLRLPEFTDYLPKAKDDRERNNLIARIKRLGVNLPIQGGTSTIMQHGFFNNIRESVINGWSRILQPLITVHDSNTNYFGAEYLWDIIPFYTEHYTNHCATVGPKIFLLWDLNSGTAYEKACSTKLIDEDTIEYSGSSDQIIDIYDKLMKITEFKVECSMTRDEIVSKAKYVKDPIKRMILESGACMIKDTSKLKVRFRRIK